MLMTTLEAVFYIYSSILVALSVNNHTAAVAVAKFFHKYLWFYFNEFGWLLCRPHKP